MKKHTLVILFFTLSTLLTLNLLPAKESAPASAIAKEKAPAVDATQLYNNYIGDIYNSAGLDRAGLDLEVFKKALTGYYNLKRSNSLSAQKQIISIVDFTRSSQDKRLWIIDLSQKKLLFNTLVAHGKGSGENMATQFSNHANSHQSSLGFYVTSDTYQGKHGLSLRLNGMDKGFNNNALSRAVVVHGASYVSQDFIQQHGRLGRSHGCPALPQELTPAIIEAIKGRTCLFINGAETSYTSDYLNERPVISYLSESALISDFSKT